MGSSRRLAVASVAIVAVAIVAAIRLLPVSVPTAPTPGPSSSSTVTQPRSTPTTTPAPAPTATPIRSPATPIPLPAGGTGLRAGRYAIQVPHAPVIAELTVGHTGWAGNEWYISDGERSLSFWTVANVYDNACLDSSLPEPPIGPTVKELVTALDAQVGTDLQAFFNPTVGGYPSTRVIMRPSAGMDAACPGGTLKLWQIPGSSEGRSIATTGSPDGREDVIWIVDVDGHRVVIVGYYDADGDDIDTMLGLVDSIEFVVP